MKFLTVLFICVSHVLFGQQKQWPVIKHYEGKFTERIAMPVGGIGTGDISIGGNGQWRDVEIMNKPAMGFYGAVVPKQAPCFMVFTQTANGEKKTKTLMGPIPTADYAGSEGSRAPNHGLPRFSTATFDAAYPFATVNLEDDDMPVSAKAKVFNPCIPGDADASGIPVAVIRYEITNKTDNPLTVSVAGSLDNFIGMDGSIAEISSWNSIVTPRGTKNNRNTFRQTTGLAGIYMTSDSVDKNSKAWGTIALTTPKNNPADVISYRTEFNTKGWNSNFTDLWDDFSDDGVFKDLTFPLKWNDPRGALAVKFRLAARETRTVQFFLTWDFPNRTSWFDEAIIGNYYSTHYTDAWDVIEKTLPLLPALESKTIDFVTLLANSDYPQEVKEAALFNSSTLRSQTTFRDKEGNFFGWEGVFASTGSCHGNCTHVWNYEQASPFLFGSLAMSMRQTEYKHALDDSSGLMSFRVNLPFDKTKNSKVAAADGQMGTIMKVYREWQLSGNDNFLKDLYPGVKKALSFAWIEKGWDANKDGVMEGCQHNTMDIEYYGPNPEIGFWYLGALKSAAAMAHYMNDKEFEKTCSSLFAKGSKWIDENIFNGEFYYQKIWPVKSLNDVAKGLTLGMGARDISNPEFQIGEGCLVDQLVGQNMAFICGLGYLADSNHIKKALSSIWKYNHLKSFGDHFNNMRSYALGDEAGLVVTVYPDPSKRPAIPLSYAFEAWTGVEYTAAAGMYYVGMDKEAEQVIKDTRNRYDGFKRNPFNEEECGNHYVRAMASWSEILALSKFNYSAVTKTFSITAKPGNYFWSDGYSWGNAMVNGNELTIKIYYGKININEVRLVNTGSLKLKKTVSISENGSFTFVIK
jgi:non-lysosomal glucosylceramidase